ncbi:MAG: AraC family transcriptional regulator [Kiritimatiellales bacterium]
MKSKARIFRSDEEYVYIPNDSKERFLTSPDPSNHPLLDQDIQLAGISDLTSGYHVTRCRYPGHLIQYTLSGSGMLKANGQTRELKPGDVFCAPWKSEYSYRTDHEWRILWLHLRPRSKWDKLIDRQPHVHRAAWMTELERLMEGYIGEINRRRTDSSILLHSYSHLIVNYIQRELGKENPVTFILERVWNEVQQNVAHKWTIQELAETAGMSRTCFYHAVSEQTGATPMQVVHTIRMEHACARLLYTNHTVDSIAEAVGYEDRFAFSKAFKRYAKVGPAQFRQR